MKTTQDGVETEAVITVQMQFSIGKKTVTQEIGLDVEDFLKDPEQMGDTLRSFWFQARRLASETHRELGNAPQSPNNQDEHRA